MKKRLEKLYTTIKGWKIYFIVSGALSLIWFIIRTGRKPSRANYPCQKVALNNSLLFFSYILSFVGIQVSKRAFKANIKKYYYALFMMTGVVLFGVAGFVYWTVRPDVSKADWDVNSHVVDCPGGDCSGADPRVVAVHNTSAVDPLTTDDYGTYYDFVDQTTVNQMLDGAVLELTNESTISAAWDALFSEIDSNGNNQYDIGEKIGIKVNLNNANAHFYPEGEEDRGEERFNALPHPVIAIMNQLTAYGVVQDDIYIYDCTSNAAVANRDARERIFYPSFADIVFEEGFEDVHYVGRKVKTDPDDPHTFNHERPGFPGPAGDLNMNLIDSKYKTGTNGDTAFCTQVVDVFDYIINVPLLRAHGNEFGFTLGMKNHFGSVLNTGSIHHLVAGRNKAAVVRINENTNIKDKTLLIVGDGLFANKYDNTGQISNIVESFVIGQDPVAVDSVFLDLLSTTLMSDGRTITDIHDTTLRCAAWGENNDAIPGVDDDCNTWQPVPTGNLGVHEHANFNGSPTDITAWTYTEIDYQACEGTCSISSDPVLSVSKVGTGSGTVTSSPAGINCGADCSEAYPSGTDITLTAVDGTGSHFDGWSGGVCSGTGTCVVNLTVSDTVTATFTLDTHTVTFIEGSNGSISGTLTQVVNYGGSTTEVTAVGNSNYHFLNWTGDYTGTDNPLTITNVTDDMNITANFEIDSYTVTFTAGINGSISGDTVQTVDHGGSTIEVTALADTNYHFLSWSGDYSGSENPLTLTNITSDMDLTADFEIDSYTVTFTAGQNGSISGDTVQTVDHGGSTTEVTAVADANYHFLTWSGDYTGSDNPLILANVTNDMDVTADFEENSSEQQVCESNGGFWDEQSYECTGISESVCTSNGGSYEACVPSCSSPNDSGGTFLYCSCIKVCSFGGGGASLNVLGEGVLTSIIVNNDTEEELTIIDENESTNETNSHIQAENEEPQPLCSLSRSQSSFYYYYHCVRE